MDQPDPPTPTELAYRALDAFARGDRAAWDATQHPEVECLPADVWPEAGRIVGREALWRFYRDIDDVWEPGEWALTEVVETGDSVLVCQRRAARGRASSVEVDFTYWSRLTVADGMVARHEWFAERPAES